MIQFLSANIDWEHFPIRPWASLQHGEWMHLLPASSVPPSLGRGPGISRFEKPWVVVLSLWPQPVLKTSSLIANQYQLIFDKQTWGAETILSYWASIFFFFPNREVILIRLTLWGQCLKSCFLGDNSIFFSMMFPTELEFWARCPEGRAGVDSGHPPPLRHTQQGTVLGTSLANRESTRGIRKQS